MLNNSVRIGIGEDSHKFSTVLKPLVLGGVTISKEGGFKTNSDGDVILHSLCNALSSAIGGDSLGTWSDEMCLKNKITDSKEYVRVVFKKVKDNKYKIGNVSISIEAKKPYLSIEQLNKIKMSLSQILKIRFKQIGLTITSGEGLTKFGKGVGIRVSCAVLLIKNG
ncbi:MAG: 2-C-methyl-D-erythritol 2,4-cyclodiphosphate synthase [bacterium]